MYGTGPVSETGSHAPGPPRFTAVGESVELAPRDPDPAGRYAWRLLDAPDGSDVSIGETPVIELSPDEPGIYTLELEAPDGTHRQRVRAFPDERRDVRVAVHEDELPAPPAVVDRLSVLGPFNEHRLCLDRPSHEGNEWVAHVRLPPGEHWFIFAVNDDLERSHRETVTVPGPGRPRLHLSAAEGDGVISVEARVRAAPDGDLADEAVDVEFYLDDRDHLAREDVTIEDRRLRVPVDALSDSVRIHAVPVGERHGVADVVTIAPGGEAGAAVAIDRPNDPPAWAREATVYQIFVRSFAGETPVTTFAEIERRIPYLASLHVDAVWLTPIFASPTTHGYHVTDYFETAADLGSLDAFESLVDAFHDAGIRVILDLVINHTSRDHPAFQLHAAGVDAFASHYRRTDAEHDVSDIDWAALPAGDAPEYYFNWTSIPNLNYDALAVRRWMLDVVDAWAGLVDGFRADVAWGVPHGIWKEVAARVSADFLLLDETIPHDPAYHEAEFHAHYDTTLFGALREIGTGGAPADAIHDALEGVATRGFPDAALHLRYVENHDEERYLAECGRAALRAAAGATFTLPGIPMIYYGQERGATRYRGPMPWHDGDTSLTAFHRSLAELRDAEPVLRTGAIERLDYRVLDGDPAAVTAYARDDGERRLLVVLHFGSASARVHLGEAHAGTDVLRDESVADDPIVPDVVVLPASR